MMIELVNVYKRLGGRNILNGLSVSIDRGETLAIVGPSGTGKSVTLNHIIGLMSPDRGSINVMGRDVAKLGYREMQKYRSKVGMLFQSGALLGWMTVYDNVALPLRECFHLPEEKIRQKVGEMLEFLNLTDSAGKYPNEISGGMQKRAGLARTVVCDPEIMLYDEPTSGLDPVMSRKIDELIVSLQKRFSMTSVVVTHDLCSAFGIADKIAMLYGGKVVEYGTPEQFKASRNELVREFIRAQFSINIQTGGER